MKRLILFLFTLFAINLLVFSQNEAVPKNVKSLEIPKIHTNETIISHLGYTLSYNETHEQANWVAYQLTSEETNRLYKRTNKFLVDPKVKTGSANHEDYVNSGYDRGHLAPAADMGWSSTAMAESFYFSNMSPQDPGFNRGVWKRLEELVRTWAVEYKSVYVVTAPILSTALQTIGENKVSIPKYFYKVILDYTEPSVKGIGFIIPNSSSNEPLQVYAVTIDHVEALSGIDFFPALPDEQENSIESTLNINSWTWKSLKTTTTKKAQTTESVQCNGTTKKGLRCKNKTRNSNGFCHQHS